MRCQNINPRVRKKDCSVPIKTSRKKMKIQPPVIMKSFPHKISFSNPLFFGELTHLKQHPKPKMITATRYFMAQAARRSLRETAPKATRFHNKPRGGGAQERMTSLALLFGMGCTFHAILDTLIDYNKRHPKTLYCTSMPLHKTYCDAAIPTGGDVIMLAPTKEKATGILFPGLCNGLRFVGCGVRVKYGFIKVYAVGT